MSERDRWDRRYREGAHAEPAEPDWLVAFDDVLPRRGRALDVAAGSAPAGRWLARRGLSVTAVDVSAVGLELARERAAAEGLVLETVARDLEAQPLPDGPWDVIACFHYLQRDLFALFETALAPGGVLVCEIATVRNLERHERPSRRFLLEEGELAGLVPGLVCVSCEEGWFGDRAVARLVARRV